MTDQLSDFSECCLLVTKPEYVFVDRVLKEVANQQILSKREFKKFAKSLRVYLNQKRIYFGEPVYYKICESLERHPVDFKEDLLNSILLDLTMIDSEVEIAEDTDGSSWIIISQSQKIWDSVEEISMREQLEVNILDVSLLTKLMKEANADKNLMESLDLLNAKLKNSRNQKSLENGTGNKYEENIESENKILEISHPEIRKDEEIMENKFLNYSNDENKIENIDSKTISRNQEIFNQLDFIVKIEEKFTNKSREIKNYKNYKIYNQSEFIRKNDIKNFINEYNSLNKFLWIYNIKRHKPKLYQLIMENQIKHYLHIQQIKRLYNEINIIKRYKRECKVQNLIDQMQTGIQNREDFILNIIGVYDLLEYYYCKGNIEMLKKIMRVKEEEIHGYFLQEELDKYQLMLDSPNTI